jgi:hypothetical protein
VGRGYVIGSELDYERLRRQTKISLVVTLVLLGFISVLVPPYLSGFVVVAVALMNFAWMRYLLGGLASPAERLSWQESLTLQSPRGWSSESLQAGMIGAIAFVAFGVILFAIDHAGNWPLATMTISRAVVELGINLRIAVVVGDSYDREAPGIYRGL